MTDSNIEKAIALMDAYALRTGITSEQLGRRYLWTDAFAVCNFLSLARAARNPHYLELALRLVDQVHQTLGRHREDDPRKGWISGLSEHEGEVHPTQGGLRIGKALPERRKDEPFDERLEWERDGQYFHYLTKWMHALDQVSRSTGTARFNTWARELAAAAHLGFTYLQPGSPAPRMYWKMSIDLDRPLVPSMGQHDPLDGYITIVQLRATAAALPQSVGGPDLDVAARQFATMLKGVELASPDPLGIGGLLVDAFRLEQLFRSGIRSDQDILEQLLAAALTGLRHYASSGELQAPATYRLAFREFGLAIGMQAVERMSQAATQGGAVSRFKVKAQLDALRRYTPLGDAIEAFWRRPDQQRTTTWIEHRDINEVMLATCLVPDGFLIIPPIDRPVRSQPTPSSPTKRIKR